MKQDYDVIVVGARCAGSPTGMLLARMGYRVLVVDRAHFPSDTLSTHVVQAPAVAALSRWGLLDRLRATGCPALETYSFDFGHLTIKGTPRPAAAGSAAYAPRRTVLDEILVEACAEAGAEVRQGFNVDEVLVEDGVVCGIRGHSADGTPVTERARIVIGADGRNSHVHRAVGSPAYVEKPRLQWSYYTYFSGLPVDGFEIFVRPDRGWAAAETNDGLTMLVVGWPFAEAQAYKADIEGNFLRTLDMAPEFAERVRGATREASFNGGAVHNYFRKPFGPGWALVGDAGYSKDPITAQGINDAFRDAESCSAAVNAWLQGNTRYDEAMAFWQQDRDARVMPIFEFTTQLATLEPPPPEMQQLLVAVRGSQKAMDDFVSLTAGTVSPLDFFAPDNLGALMQGTDLPVG